MKAQRLATVAAAAFAVAALAGCGGSGGGAVSGAQSSTDPGSRAALPGTGRPPVVVGDKNFTEQFVLGELYAQALQAEGYTVDLNRSIGPVEVSTQALMSGQLSMYPEYVDTWDTSVAGIQQPFDSPAAALRAGRRFARSHGLRLLTPTPFSDTAALAVTTAFAAAHHLRQIPDLRRVAATLTLGAPLGFGQSSTGLTLLEQDYGFTPAGFKALAIGTQYTELDQGTVQAAIVQTTDGQLAGGRYRLLRDPLHFFGWGQVVPVVPVKVLDAEGPAFARTIDRVSALLDTSAIRTLNAAVDVQGQDPATVAKQFLAAHGVVPAG